MGRGGDNSGTTSLALLNTPQHLLPRPGRCRRSLDISVDTLGFGSERRATSLIEMVCRLRMSDGSDGSHGDCLPPEDICMKPRNHETTKPPNQTMENHHQECRETPGRWQMAYQHRRTRHNVNVAPLVQSSMTARVSLRPVYMLVYLSICTGLPWLHE